MWSPIAVPGRGFGFEAVEKMVPGDDVFEPVLRNEHLVCKSHLAAAALGGIVLAGIIYEHLPHQLCRDSEEVRPVLPVDPAKAYKPQKSLIHQCGRLQRVTRALVTERTRCDAPKFTVR